MESKQNNNKYRAMIGRKSKSRKGKCWANKKKQPECEEMRQCSTSTISNEHAVERSLQQEDDRIHESRKVFKPLENKSKVKLINTSFSKIENSPSKLKKTRSTTAKLGIRKHTELYESSGYKMVDFSLLQDCLNRTSCIKLYTDPNKKRYGLAEHFIMRCKHEKSSYTSKRTKKDGKESF